MADDGDRARAPTSKIFISYSRTDLGFADALAAALKARGFEPLIDRTEISAFEDWWERIKGLIGQSDTVVFVLSPDAAASKICSKEVEYAASLNKRFAPIVCRRVEDSSVPEPLRRLNFVYFDGTDGFDEGMRRLSDALSTDMAWVRKHTEYGEHARRWSAAGQPGPGGLMLRPPVLEEAEAWLAFRPGSAPLPTDETLAFIAASRRVFEQEEAARQEQVDRRLISESRRLADLAARETADGNYGAAVALSLEALPDESSGVRRPFVPAAERTLFNACRQMREVRVLEVSRRGRPVAIADAAFSPDGSRVVATSYDGMARLWDADSGEEIAAIKVGESTSAKVAAIARAMFSADGARFVTWLQGKGENHVAIWNALDGRREISIELPHASDGSELRFAAFEPSATSATGSSWRTLLNATTERLGIASAGSAPRLLVGCDAVAYLFDTRRGRMLAELTGHGGAVLCGSFSHDGAKVVTGSADQMARVWDAATGKELTVLRGHKGRILIVKFNRDATRVLTVSRDLDRIDTARLWDAATGRELSVLCDRENPGIVSPFAISSASFSPDATRVLTAANDGSARIWDATTGRELLRIAPLDGRGSVTACFSRDGTRLLCAMRHIAGIWNASNGAAITTFKGHDDTVSIAGFDVDGSRVLTASSDGTARIWSTEAGTPHLALHGSEAAGPPNALGYVSKGVAVAEFSPDGTRIVTVSTTGVSRLWDAATGDRIAEVAGENQHIASFSRDGRRLLSSSWFPNIFVESYVEKQSDDSVTIASALDGAKLASFAIDGRRVAEVVLTTDEARVVVSGEAPRIRDRLGDTVVSPLTDGVDLAVLCHEGFRVAFARGDLSRELKVTSRSGALLFEGMRFIGWPDARLAVIRDLSSGQERCELKTRRWWVSVTDREDEDDEDQLKHSYGLAIRTAEFSPDEALLVTALTDASIRLWDASTGAELGIFRGHRGEVTAARFSPDGRRLVTASFDGTVRLWDVASCQDIGTLVDGCTRILDAAFSRDGTRIVIAADDDCARIFPAPQSTQALVEHAKRRIPSVLTPREREAFYLDPAPPIWWIESQKWPYHTEEWQQWLRDFRMGLNPSLPDASR